jgi:hypothetical protein
VQGGDREARNPRIVGPDEAVALARGPVKVVLASGRFPVFLLLDRGLGARWCSVVA